MVNRNSQDTSLANEGPIMPSGEQASPGPMAGQYYRCCLYVNQLRTAMTPAQIANTMSIIELA